MPKIKYFHQPTIDAAMDSIAAAQKQPEPNKEPGAGVTVTIPQKSVKVIRAQELSSKTYLETEDEVDAYLAKLRKALLTALQEGKKARIQ